MVPLLCVPGALILAWHVAFGYIAVQLEARTLTGRDWMPQMVALTTAYSAGGLAMLVAQYRRLHEPAEQRRLRLLLTGAAIGALAAVLVETEYWLGSSSQVTSGLFHSPLTLAGVLLLLPFPLSVAYVVLRQRVFDIGSILRQGVRYALARRLLIGLVPVLALALVADILLRHDQPIGPLLQARGWLYALVAGALGVTLVNRRRWLDQLDRRFFRERHRAEQVLHSVAARLRTATDPAGAAAHVVDEVAAALQPAFVGALAHRGDTDPFAILAATPSFPRQFAPAPGWTLVGLARATGSALQLSPDHDTWITQHLTADESHAVFDAEVELVVPVTVETGREVLLVLGPKRSEEPYTRDDIALLEAIAASLGLLLDRAVSAAPAPMPDEGDASLAECPECGACFDTSLARCPHDGVLLMVSDLPPVLAGRYRFEALIGAGGMGRVYRARDEALVRRVAVKVIGDHLVGSSEAAERFRREAQVAASFTHPNVVTVYDVGVTRSGRAFLLMECLEGRTLREAISRDGALDVPRASRVIGDICHVLHEAHSRRLVHRDLKPENVFLARSTDHEVTKLLDFGIAKVLAGSSSVTTPRTHADVIVGSLAYMSPEQLAGGGDITVVGSLGPRRDDGRDADGLAATQSGEPPAGRRVHDRHLSGGARATAAQCSPRGLHGCRPRRRRVGPAAVGARVPRALHAGHRLLRP